MDKDSTPFSKGELTLIFRRIEEKLDGLRDDVRSNYTRLENDIKAVAQRNEVITGELRKDVDTLKIFQARALVIWGIVVFAAGIIVNKVF